MEQVVGGDRQGEWVVASRTQTTELRQSSELADLTSETNNKLDDVRVWTELTRDQLAAANVTLAGIKFALHLILSLLVLIFTFLIGWKGIWPLG